MDNITRTNQCIYKKCSKESDIFFLNITHNVDPKLIPNEYYGNLSRIPHAVSSFRQFKLCKPHKNELIKYLKTKYSFKYSRGNYLTEDAADRIL